MPTASANQTVRELAPEILAAVKHTPVLAGVCGTDPFLLRTHFLQELRDLGFTGIQNFPTVGLIDGQFRKNLEETGMGYGLEVDCIAEAHAMDFLTVPYVFDNEQARADDRGGGRRRCGAHGPDNHGDDRGGTPAKSLSKCVDEIREIADAAKAVRDQVLVLCHGGPIASPEDAQYMLDHCSQIDGFFGASSMERLPTETAISDQARKFVGMKLRRRKI